jgi:hypothetical protein
MVEFEPGTCFSRYVGGMIVGDQLDRGAGRTGGEKLEEVDELSAADLSRVSQILEIAAENHSR